MGSVYLDKLLARLTAAIVFMLSSYSENYQVAKPPGLIIDFDADWRFAKGDIASGRDGDIILEARAKGLEPANIVVKCKN